MKDFQEIVILLQSMKNEERIKAAARFAIKGNNILGISIPELRNIAKSIKVNQELALFLWNTKIHEARLLAVFIADKKRFDKVLMETWISTFDSWDICDQACSNIFAKQKDAFALAIKWSGNEGEFQRRAAFALMACLSHKTQKAKDEDYFPFFEQIIKYSIDERNFVKKAVNWALRDLGKRSKPLLEKAIETSETLLKDYADSKSALWIANDALREFKAKFPNQFIGNQ